MPRLYHGPQTKRKRKRIIFEPIEKRNKHGQRQWRVSCTGCNKAFVTTTANFNKRRHAELCRACALDRSRGPGENCWGHVRSSHAKFEILLHDGREFAAPRKAMAILGLKDHESLTAFEKSALIGQILKDEAGRPRGIRSETLNGAFGQRLKYRDLGDLETIRKFLDGLEYMPKVPGKTHIESAAKAVGVAYKTFLRWLKEDGVVAAKVPALIKGEARDRPPFGYLSFVDDSVVDGYKRDLEPTVPGKVSKMKALELTGWNAVRLWREQDKAGVKTEWVDARKKDGRRYEKPFIPLSLIAHAIPEHNRVGGGVTAPVLPHHRTYSSYPAVSVNVVTANTFPSDLPSPAP